jgi:hypothetical protein
MNPFSGVLIPIVALFIPIVAIIASQAGEMHKRRVRADQQMALIARGVPLPELEAFLKVLTANEEAGKEVKDPMRSLSNARRSATVLVSVGAGLVLFFLTLGTVMLSHVDKEAGWALIACSAAGLIPLAIGIGFFFDYNLQKRELARFGLEISADTF